MSHVDQSLTVVERGNALSIQSNDDYLIAAQWLKDATALDRKIEEHYKPLKQAADRLHDDLCAAEKQQRSPLIQALAYVKGLLIGYDQRQKKIAAEAQKAAQSEATAKGGTTAPVLQVVASTPKVEGISGRANWKAVVDDESLLPREYLCPDMKKLNDAAKRMRESFNVPGAYSFNDRGLTVKGV